MKALRVLAAILAMFIISCGQTDKKTEDGQTNTSADATAPTTPTGLIANDVTATSIGIKWYASSDNVGVDGYKVIRKEGANGVALEAGKTTALTTYFQSTSLNAATDYCFTVYAYDKAGNLSGGSNEVCAITNSTSTGGQTDLTAPTAPMGLIANAVSLSQIDLSWSASTDDVAVTGYNVYDGAMLLMTVNATSASATGLTAATAYCYTVSALDAAGNESIQSSQACATTLSSGGANTAPVANAGPDQSVTTGSLVTFNGSGSMDTDGDTITYDWTFASGPGGSVASLSNAGSANPVFTADVDGQYVVSLVVNDGTVNSVADTVTITASTSTPLPTGLINLPKTGQATSYAIGDDGELEMGVAWPPTRFTVGTGAEVECVTDNLTGLMWVKSPDSTTKTWQQALDYANGLTLCGYTDWRLPNRKELESLVNAEQSNTATWLNGQGFSNVQSVFYWSSSTYASYTDYAWHVNMWNGGVGYGSKAVSSYVWPVRAGQSGSFDNSVISLSKTGQTTCYNSSGSVIACTGTGQDGEIKAGVAWPNPRFTVGTGAEAECVTDNLTGLMWTKNANLPNGTKTWQGALDYANGLTLCGYTDWRLPNRKELESLVNAEQSNTATWLNGQGFSNVQSDFYWSSSTSASYTDYAWYVNMWDGYVVYDVKTFYGNVWPVRVGQ